MAIPASEVERSPVAARDNLRYIVRAAAEEFLKRVFQDPSKIEVEGAILRNKCEDAAQSLRDLIS